MSKQIIKNLTMLTLAIGLALAATVVSANGQSRSTLARADIPFDFIVADKTFPSGKYTVTAVTSEGVSIRSRDGKSSAIRLSNLVPDNREKRTAKMVFHRYGQQYFLAEVWSGDEYGHKLRQCKKERILSWELAANTSKSDSVKGSYEIVEVVAQVR